MPAPIRVGIRDLVGASKSYIEAQVKKANLNGNAYLTQEEAKKLPADLRDNYENFRKAGHSRVTVKQFTESFTAYVTKSAKAADKNGDGVLTKTDARSLPKDLRDNFLNYVTATQAPTPPAPVSETDRGRLALANYVNNVLFNTGNAEGAAFREAVLDHRTPADRANVRTQMLAEAARWSPTDPEWEKIENNGTTAYCGRLFQLYTEVKFKPGQTAPEIYLEID